MVLLLRASGEVVLANAGHLAPYWNGQEIPTDAALPLGLDEHAEFFEVHVQLQTGDRLTLLTDGVPEAMCRRELFGFERTALLSTQDAGLIADEAVRFGQQDDITVLSLVAVS
jgi:serine phosphatase RsbU (regulator of sigma subunit)